MSKTGENQRMYLIFIVITDFIYSQQAVSNQNIYVNQFRYTQKSSLMLITDLYLPRSHSKAFHWEENGKHFATHPS